MKTKNKLFILIMAIVMVFSAVGCATIIDGSKITKAVMTLEFYNAEGEVASTSTVTLHLYENNAPETVKHVKKLINDKYYDGVCVNNVADYFIELGEYYYQDGVMVKKPYEYGMIEGEFEKNGFENQRLGATKGAIVMKHDRVTTSTDVYNYDTATSGLMFMTKGLMDISEKEYCVIGRVVESDGEESVSTSSSTTSIDRSDLSSFGIINSIKDIALNKTDERTVTTFYHAKTNTWYKKVVEGGETTVYKTEEGKEEVQITDTEEKEEFLNIFSGTGSFKDEFYEYSLVPYQKVIVKSIRIKK